MKNISKTNVLKTFVSIIFTALFIFSMTACGDGGGNTPKTITITGISAEYDGKEMSFIGVTELFWTAGMSFAHGYTGTIWGEQESPIISDDTWTSGVKEWGYYDYTGSDSFWVVLIIQMGGYGDMFIYKGDADSPNKLDKSTLPQVSFSSTSISLDFDKFMKIN